MHYAKVFRLYSRTVVRFFHNRYGKPVKGRTTGIILSVVIFLYYMVGEGNIFV
jgi:hypothetical protein